MQKDCYYYVDEKGTIKAMCTRCNSTKSLKTGLGSRIWFWPGSSKGYGSVDIKCAICGEDIYIVDDANQN